MKGGGEGKGLGEKKGTVGEIMSWSKLNLRPGLWKCRDLIQRLFAYSRMLVISDC